MILVLGLVFRISGIFWGLPLFDPYARYFHPDEPKIIHGAFTFPEHIWRNTDLRYPTAFHYLLGILALPFKLLPERTGYDFTYGLGRVISVLAGTITVLITFLLTKKIFDERQALLASFLIAFSMLHVTNSAWATTDVLSSCWMTLFLLLLNRTLEIGIRKDACFTGIALGLCIGTKYTAVVGIIPVLLLYFQEASKASGNYVSIKFLRLFLGIQNLLWILGIAMIVFLITTPGIIVFPQHLGESLEFETARLAQSALPFYHPRVYLNQIASMGAALGWPLAISSLIGIVLVFIRRERVASSWAVMVIVYSIYLGNAMLPRYWIIMMPLLAIFASYFLLVIVQSPVHWKRMIGYSIAALTCSYTFIYAIAGIVSRYPDPRIEAAHFFEANVPKGVSFGFGNISDEFIHLWRYPKIDPEVYQASKMLKRPDYIILTSYEYEAIRETISRKILDSNYRLPQAYWDEWYRRQPPTARQFRFNEALWLGKDPEYCLMKKFAPRLLNPNIEFPPPTIEIFTKQRAPGAKSVECNTK